jgi:Nuclease A inhibitor-like protein
MKPTPESPILDTLGKATFGLLFPSESDAPFTPYRFPGKEGEEPTAAALLEAEGLPSTTPVETITLDELFDPFVEEGPSAPPEDLAEAKRYRDLVKLLSSELTEVRVHRVGATDIDVYVLGKDPCGAWVGLKTHVVET